MADFENIVVERSEAVLTLRVSRPKVLNALDPATLREIARVLRDVRRDGGVRALVVTGTGEKAFSAGADIKVMATMPPTEGHPYSRLGHEVLGRFEQLPIPVVAAVNGAALGGGLELALACDVILAADTAKFGLPEITVGLIPGFGGTQRLALRVGLARARELIYLGTMIDADEALRIGLVSRVVPAAKLAEEALGLARQLVAKPPVALRQAKRATAAAAAALAEGLRYETDAFAVAFATEDRVEGMTAFVEKRAPVWKGR
ncbi:MAG TPA: enoyl-CoA hydratase-related protein [Candidatus Eisenbacteria bacterium]|nr:enoyl-CoA hydratase-related protein [Candidatus Eisenbacteria bacterium]